MGSLDIRKALEKGEVDRIVGSVGHDEFLELFVSEFLVDETEIFENAIRTLKRFAEEDPEFLLKSMKELVRETESKDAKTRYRARSALYDLTEGLTGKLRELTEQGLHNVVGRTVEKYAEYLLSLKEEICFLSYELYVLKPLKALLEEDVELIKPAVSIFTEALCDVDRRKRRMTALCLNLLAGYEPRAVIHVFDRLMESFLNDPDDPVRENLVMALADIAESRPGLLRKRIQELKKGLYDKNSFVALGSLKILMLFEDEDGLLELLVSKLVEFLNDENECVRGTASRILGGLAGEHPELVKPAIPKLIELLDDKSCYWKHREVWEEATEALARIAEVDAESVKPAVITLLERLDDEDPDVRQRALDILGRIIKSGKELLPLALSRIIRRLDDPDALVRWKAVCVIGKLDFSEVCNDTVALIYSKLTGLSDDPFMRPEVFDALAAVARGRSELVEEVVSKLLEHLEDLDFHAVDALGAIGEMEPKLAEGVIRKLTELLGSMIERGIGFVNMELETVVHAISKLTRTVPEIRGLAHELVLPHLFKALNTWPFYCFRVLEMLEDIEVTEEGPASVAAVRILGCLHDEDLFVRQAAIKALTRLARGNQTILKAVVPHLIERLEDGEASVRAAAASALGELGEASGVPLGLLVTKLLEHLDDERYIVRWKAVYALGRLVEQEPEFLGSIVPGLIERLGDERSEVRGLAAYLLGRFEVKEALGPLQGLLDDDETAGMEPGESVGDIAREAIESIRTAQSRSPGE